MSLLISWPVKITTKHALLLPAALYFISAWLILSSRICVYFVYIIYHNLDSLIMLVDRFRTAQSRKRFIWGSMKINHHRCFIAHCTIALAYPALACPALAFPARNGEPYRLGIFLKTLLPWWWGVQMAPCESNHRHSVGNGCIYSFQLTNLQLTN